MLDRIFSYIPALRRSVVTILKAALIVPAMFAENTQDSAAEEHRNWLGQLRRETAEAIAHGNATRVFGVISAPSQ